MYMYMYVGGRCTVVGLHLCGQPEEMNEWMAVYQ
jgi:hypothetical protein